MGNYEYFDKQVAAKDRDPQRIKDLKLQEEWLKNNKPKVGVSVDINHQTTCSMSEEFYHED